MLTYFKHSGLQLGSQTQVTAKAACLVIFHTQPYIIIIIIRFGTVLKTKDPIVFVVLLSFLWYLYVFKPHFAPLNILQSLLNLASCSGLVQKWKLYLLHSTTFRHRKTFPTLKSTFMSARKVVETWDKNLRACLIKTYISYAVTYGFWFLKRAIYMCSKKKGS